MLTRVALLMAWTATVLVGCTRSSYAAQQEQLKNTIETHIFTKFIETGPSTEGKPIAFAVVLANPGESNTVHCDYQDETGSGAVVVNVIKIDDSRAPSLTYEMLGSNDAVALLGEAKRYGGETYRLSEMLGKAKYHPSFPRDSSGERHFLMNNCTT